MNRDMEQKIAGVMAIDEIIREMNDEEAIIRWLEEGVPDHMEELTYEDIDMFLEDVEYATLVLLFLEINTEYPDEGILDKFIEKMKPWAKKGED